MTELSKLCLDPALAGCENRASPAADKPAASKKPSLDNTRINLIRTDPLSFDDLGEKQTERR